MTHAVGIIATERNVDVALNVVSFYSYLFGVGLTGKALEVNCRRGGPYYAYRRLNTDNHYLIQVEVGACVIDKGIQGTPGVALTAPTEVDVILVGA